MAIMVDEAKYPFRGQNYCHMMSDCVNRQQAEQELHDFAARLGLQRRWFQQSARNPHYDLAPSKRALAIRLGAKEVTSRAMVFLNPFNAELWKGADTFCNKCYWCGHHSELQRNPEEYAYCPRCEAKEDFGSVAQHDEYIPF